MALGNIDILKGESRLITMYLSAAAGTVSASSPTFSLYDGTGAVVAAFNNVAATADPAAATIKVQYLLDTFTLAAGAYLAVLKAAATTSADNVTQTRQYDCDVYVRRVPDIP